MTNRTDYPAAIREGHYWESRVAKELARRGCSVTLGPQTVREHYEDRGQWAGEIDLVVEGRPLDVKSVSRTFQEIMYGPGGERQWSDGAPREPQPIFVMADAAWWSKDPSLDAVIVVSRVNGRALVAFREDIDEYGTIVLCADVARGFSYPVRALQRKFWHPIRWLLNRYGVKG